jgi:ribosomal protein L22
MDFFRPSKKAPPLDPTSADFLKRKNPQSAIMRPQIGSGGLASTSLFDDGTEKPADEARKTIRDPMLMQAALDPEPEDRRRWERKMVIKEIRARQRVNKTTILARTERVHLVKSHMFKTSIKKLGPLARQIAGKPIEHAIVQMRFSKKKVAQDVLRHLEFARDEAVVKKGMGLGGVAKEVGKGEEEAVKVQEKAGGRIVNRAKTDMYVEQAWVGRGTYGQEPDYRARGQINLMRPPYTSKLLSCWTSLLWILSDWWIGISVVLKEEATRARLLKEREEKRAKRKTWVALPDRPVTAQRQYALW